MSFLAPLYVGFVALIAVPILIHLFGRERARPVRFSAMELLLGAERKVAQRNRVQRWVLLAVRALLIAAIPLALAQPFFMTPSDGVVVGGTQSAVLVVDTSASMGYRDGDTTRLDAAKRRAQTLIESLGNDSEIALLAGTRDGDAPVKELTRDRTRLVRAIENLVLEDAAGDLAGALRRANQLLEAAARPRKVIYLVSDFQHGALVAPLPPVSAEVVFVDVAASSPRNHAITDVTIEPAPELGARAVRIAVSAAAFGAPERAVPLQVRIDDQPIAQAQLDLDVGQTAQRKFTHVFADVSGVQAHDIVAELPADALSIDDRRYAHMVVDRNVRVLLVDGDPRTQRREDELFYLEAAVRAAGGLEAATIHADQLTAERLATTDVVVLANVRAPAAEILRPFVERGGGLVLAIGGNVDADAYNAALGALLPQPLQSIRTVGYTRDARKDGEVVQPSGALNAARIGHVDRAHPVLAPLADVRLDEELHNAQFGRYALLRPGAAEGVKVLLGFEDSAPLLVEKKVGKGTVMFFGSTMDRDWNDVVIQPLFLPLVQRLVLYLGRVAQSGAPTALMVGQAADLAVPEATREVEVKPPSGPTKKLEHGTAFTATKQVGVYHVSARVGDGKLTDHPELGFAANLDPHESDVEPMSKADREALQSKTTVNGEKRPERRVELWHTIGALVLALLLLESLLLRRK